MHSVYLPPFLAGKPSIKFQKGGLERFSIFRSGCWKREILPISDEEYFLHKNKLKSKNFNDKIN